MPKIVLISDQPVLLRGFCLHFGRSWLRCRRSLSWQRPDRACGRKLKPDLILIDITGGLSFSSLAELHGRVPGAPVVLWSDALPLDLIFKTLECGVRGIVERTARPDQLADSLRRVANGEMHIGFAGQIPVTPPRRTVSLTPREREIVMHLRQGLRNKQIATEMDITEGTVKIYLFRLFHKLGVRNRFELAKSGASTASQPFQSVM